LKKLSAIFLCMFMLVTLPGCRAASGGAVKATGSVTFGSAGSNNTTEPPKPGGGSGPWNGTWISSQNDKFGTIVLTQNGNNLTGAFDENGNKGTISGTLSGSSTVTITKTYNDGKKDSGEYLFSLRNNDIEIDSWDEGVNVWRDHCIATRVFQESPPTDLPTTQSSTTPPSGSINPELVGQWNCSFKYVDALSGLLLTKNIHYYFYDNGRFMQFTIDWVQEKFEGKYYVANGKIYFTNRVFYNGGTKDQSFENTVNFGEDYLKYKFYSPIQLDDMVAEYKFGSDDKGSYLQMATQSGIDLNRPIEAGDIFRKIQ